ncbi:hypothetical protein BV898_00351 [Hypsibius exemplaris]|uniref:G-protein coupled receptors family 1 profile domain-containing protein n=1 Tax=Hypsibius exemplaris TaxID=2072580 RepID=A0A1W0XFI3_HYPEX|nr:hypothetical protein BV898_00351 [Hypsibius exemplaris]
MMPSRHHAPVILAGIQYRSDMGVRWFNFTVNESSSSGFGLDSCNRTISERENEGAEINLPARWVEIICYPIILAMCTTGNVLVLMVLQPSRPRTTADVYMMALAITDTLVMWLRMPMWIVLVSPDLPDIDLSFATHTTIYAGVYIWLSLALYTLSDGIILTFTIERILLTMNPLSSAGHISPKTAVKILLAIFAFGLLAFTAAGVDYFSRLAAGYDLTGWDHARPQWMAKWMTIQTDIVIALVFVAFLATPTANLILTACLVKGRLKRSRDLGGHASGERTLRSGTRIAFSCACLFTIFQSPGIIFLGLTIADKAPFCSVHFTADARFTLAQLVWLFASLYYSLNFYMYCMVSQRFRKQLCARCSVFSKLFSGLTESRINSISMEVRKASTDALIAGCDLLLNGRKDSHQEH